MVLVKQRRTRVLLTLRSASCRDSDFWEPHDGVDALRWQGSHASWKTWKMTNKFSMHGKLVEFWKNIKAHEINCVVEIIIYYDLINCLLHISHMTGFQLCGVNHAGCHMWGRQKYITE